MQNDAATPRVRMQNITKSYGAVQSLRGVDLHVMPGEVLGLVGDNGAGKSTVSKVLSGAVIPDSGSIEIDGKPVQFSDPGDARGHRIEMVYQASAANPCGASAACRCSIIARCITMPATC